MPSWEIAEYLTSNGLARPNSRSMATAYKTAGFVACKYLPTINGVQRRVVAIRDGHLYKALPGSELVRLLKEDS
jgi:hypothetical protein